MAYWDGTVRPAMKKWIWKKKRCWSPRTLCNRSNRALFFKEAYYGRFYLDWEYDHDMWLSKEEFTWAVLKGEFQDDNN